MENKTIYKSPEFVFKHPDGTIITIDGWDTYRAAKRRLDAFTKHRKGFKLLKDRYV